MKNPNARYEVVGIKDGKALKIKGGFRTIKDAIELKMDWLDNGANVIITDFRESVRFDEVEIYGAEVVWSR